LNSVAISVSIVVSSLYRSCRTFSPSPFLASRHVTSRHLLTTPFDPAILESSSLDPAALHSLSNKLSALAIKNELNTPARNFIPHLTQAFEESVADNIILKRQLADSLKALGARRIHKQGKRVILKGYTT